MNGEVQVELTAIGSLVAAARISAESKHSVVWCIEQLFPLYRQFGETYDNRVTEEIRRLEQGILWKLAHEPKSSADARKVSQAVVDHLRTLHERLGLQGLEPKVRKERRAG